VRPEELRAKQSESAVPVDQLDSLVQAEFSVIGTRLRKVNGVGKVTGAALYTDDITFPGMLHAKILRSPHPHARIISIDTTEAEALDGVYATVTGKEMHLM
jgi:CO/xanthine dehydrogenase Mo-binding subunit